MVVMVFSILVLAVCCSMYSYLSTKRDKTWVVAVYAVRIVDCHEALEKQQKRVILFEKRNFYLALLLRVPGNARFLPR